MTAWRVPAQMPKDTLCIYETSAVLTLAAWEAAEAPCRKNQISNVPTVFVGATLFSTSLLVIHLIIFHFYAFLLNRILTSDKANRWNAAAACCASFNTVEVWSARRKSRAVHDTVAHFSHMFNKTTFDLMFYEGEEENQDLNKCCICCSWSGKHKLSLLCSAAVTTAPVLFGMFSQSCCWSTFACFVHSLHLELLHVWKLWRLVHHGHDGNQNRCDFMCILVHAVVWEL